MANVLTNLETDAYQGSRPISAHCKLCGRGFTASPEMTPDQGKKALEQEFNDHRCKGKKEDVSQVAARIVREATHD
jgi:hypothetical protein